MVVLVNEVDLPDLGTGTGDAGYDTTVVPEVVQGRTIYVARHPELPSVLAQGDTIDEAVDDLKHVLAEYLADMRGAGIDVPPPHAAPRTETLAVYPSDSPAENPQFEIHWTVTRGG